ncbi:MAG: hypothetical protein KC731_01650 [Myxococcales bacterium]|nr:hypothetical protein [Myxococcales bacterium]
MVISPRWRHLLACLGLALGAATCDGWDPPAPLVDCSDEATQGFYEKRIAPLFEEERPRSCNQCHLSGVDLTAWSKGSACQTMACMVSEGIVDLDHPEDSLVLAWIDRAAPQSSGITAGVLLEERQGVLEWIERTSGCGLCDDRSDPCELGGDDPVDVNACDLGEDDPKALALNDPGDCSDKTLELLFQKSFFPFRRRCWPCHFENYADQVPEAPKWIAVGDCDIASLSTFRNFQAQDWIDYQDPAKSLWILKPLDESLGGVEHGGGPKFHDYDEVGVPQMTYFSERYAACKKP